MLDYKDDEKGVNEMCETVERYAQERAEEAGVEVINEIVRKLAASGFSAEVISKSAGISLSETKAILSK